MLLRSFKPSDILSIDKIYRSHHADAFGIPSLDHVLTQRVVENDGDIVAYGMVKLFAEAIMVLDLNAKHKDKIEALKSLMSVAKADAKLVKLEQLHCFVRDAGFADILKKHFDFVSCSGEALVSLL